MNLRITLCKLTTNQVSCFLMDRRNEMPRSVFSTYLPVKSYQKKKLNTGACLSGMAQSIHYCLSIIGYRFSGEEDVKLKPVQPLVRRLNR